MVWLKLLLGRSARAFLIIASGAALGAAITFLLSHLLDPNALGLYGMLSSIIVYLTMISSLGNGATYIRYLGAFEAEKDDNGVRRQGKFWKWATRASGRIAFICCVALLLLGGVGAVHFDQFGYFVSAVFACAAIVLGTIEFSRAGLARVKGLLFLALLPRHIIRPVIFALLLGLALVGEIHLNWYAIVGIETLALGVAALIVTLYVRPPVSVGDIADRYDASGWVKGARHQVSAAMSQQWLSSLDILLVGLFFGPAVAGLYLVGAQVSRVLILGNRAAAEVAMQSISRLYFSSQLPALRRLLRNACRQSLILTTGMIVGLFLALVVFERILPPSYSESMSVIAILVAGQLVNALTGPVGVALNMTGHGAAHAKLNMAMSFALIGALAILSSSEQGAIAAATAVAMVNASANVFKSFLFYRKTNVPIFPF